DARVLMLGATFKENCPDIRNSKVIDVVRELKEHGATVDVHDPWADSGECKHEYGVRLTKEPQNGQYDAVVMAVAHKEFKDMGVRGVRRYGRKNHVLFDIKHVYPAS